MGYINNESRRFYVYVDNRVQHIRQSSHPSQWRYVPTEDNPADHASRSVPSSQLQGTSWLTGPKFLLESESSSPEDTHFDLIEPTSDAELRPEVSAFLTKVSGQQLDTTRFERFSSWSRLTRAVVRLLHVARSFHKQTDDSVCAGWDFCKKGLTTAELTKAEYVIIKAVQCKVYSEEVECIKKKQDLPVSSSLRKLHPVMDEEGLLRVGVGTTHSNLPANEMHPILLPGKHHVAVTYLPSPQESRTSGTTLQGRRCAFKWPMDCGSQASHQ